MAGGVSEGNGSAISGINVTPLVDVMLVLLVIFMVTAPMIQQGVAVDLPPVGGAALPADTEPAVVTVTVDGKTYLNEDRLEVGPLVERLLEMRAERPEQTVYLRADRDASYGTVVDIIAAIKSAGIEQLGMVTELEEL